jgi:hypothetical protein
MPICEVFGSCMPNVSWALTTGEELSCHAVFCNAFTLLLKLWRFDQPPVEHVMGDAPPIASQLSPEYLLLVRNSQLSSFGRLPRDQMKSRRLSRFSSFSREPIFIDSFPKLKLWYRQHQECMASILSGLVPGTPVHQIVDTLLDMMFRKINRGGQPLTQLQEALVPQDLGLLMPLLDSKCLHGISWRLLPLCLTLLLQPVPMEDSLPVNLLQVYPIFLESLEFKFY